MQTDIHTNKFIILDSQREKDRWIQRERESEREREREKREREREEREREREGERERERERGKEKKREINIFQTCTFLGFSKGS